MPSVRCFVDASPASGMLDARSFNTRVFRYDNFDSLCSSCPCSSGSPLYGSPAEVSVPMAPVPAPAQMSVSSRVQMEGVVKLATTKRVARLLVKEGTARSHAPVQRPVPSLAKGVAAPKAATEPPVPARRPARAMAAPRIRISGCRSRGRIGVAGEALLSGASSAPLDPTAASRGHGFGGHFWRGALG